MEGSASRSTLEVPWQELTKISPKRQEFSTDLYFRAGWHGLGRDFGGTLVPWLHRLALMTLKPDAIVSRISTNLLAELGRDNFKPVAAKRVKLTRHMIYELWRHDWKVYSTDRLALAEFWYTSTDTVVLLLADQSPIPGVPASVRLSELKGDGDPTKRQHHHLRSRLQPTNRVLNYIHVAEEPADLVRELAILFPDKQRSAFLNEFVRGFTRSQTDHVQDILSGTENSYPRVELDVWAVLKRMEDTSLAGARLAGKLRALLKTPHSVPWDILLSIIENARVRLDDWDIIVLASNLIPLEISDAGTGFEAASSSQWQTSATAQAEKPARP